MSGHIAVAEFNSGQTVLAAAQEMLKADFGLAHVTIQIEDARMQQVEVKSQF